MRVLFYINRLNGGGAERVISQLANFFSSSGDNSILVTSFRSDNEYELNEGVTRYSLENEEIVQSRLMRNATRIKKLRAIIKVVRMVRNESNRGEWSRLSFAMPAWTEGVVGNYLRDTSLRQFVSQGATSAVPCDLPLIHHLFQYAAGRGLADPEQRLRFPSGD